MSCKDACKRDQRLLLEITTPQDFDNSILVQKQPFSGLLPRCEILVDSRLYERTLFTTWQVFAIATLTMYAFVYSTVLWRLQCMVHTNVARTQVGRRHYHAIAVSRIVIVDCHETPRSHASGVAEQLRNASALPGGGWDSVQLGNWQDCKIQLHAEGVTLFNVNPGALASPRSLF